MAFLIRAKVRWHNDKGEPLIITSSGIVVAISAIGARVLKAGKVAR